MKQTVKVFPGLQHDPRAYNSVADNLKKVIDDGLTIDHTIIFQDTLHVVCSVPEPEFIVKEEAPAPQYKPIRDLFKDKNAAILIFKAFSFGPAPDQIYSYEKADDPNTYDLSESYIGMLGSTQNGRKLDLRIGFNGAVFSNDGYHLEYNPFALVDLIRWLGYDAI